MPRIRSLAFGVAACGAVALAACSENKEVLKAGTPAGGALFQSYVALGNSLTAGYQSGGINDSTQKESYAYLFAHAVGTRYAYASLTMPGCPPPIANLATQARVGGTTSTSTTCFARSAASVTGALNNVAVPGATVADPTAASTSASNVLTTIILGGKTQGQRALDANPTFVSMWIGNNDVLPAAVSGLLTPTTGISPGVTDSTVFKAAYDADIGVLNEAPNLKGGVLIGVVNVSAAPVFFPAAALFNPAVLAGLSAAVGTPITVLPSCTPTTTSLISFQIVSAIAAGQHPPDIGCEKGSIPGTAVGDIFVLDATEQAALNQVVTAYNTYIQSRATALGWAYFDPNPTLLTLRATPGAVPVFPNLLDPENPFGLYFSLDGIHPRRPAHVIIANGIIDAVNAKYGKSIAHVQ